MLPMISCLRMGGLMLLGVVLLTGCVEEKESLHEDDHELPAHWPASMADAADKIDQRIGLLGGDTQQDIELARSELQDLVEWAPEVAADTDIREEDWNLIYESSETLRKHLAAGDVSIKSFQEDFERLTSLLREAHIKLPPMKINDSLDAGE